MVIITNFTPPEAGVLHHEPGCQMLVDDVDAGTGDLYVTESEVMWAAAQSARCIRLMYRQISLHAVQRVPSPLIFMMLDYKLTLPEHAQQQDEMEEEYDADETPTTEVKFVPQNESSLTPIYEALNKGQCLHPDPADSDDNFDDDFMAAEDTEAHPDDAAARMEELSIHQSNGNGVAEDDEDEQFADA